MTRTRRIFAALVAVLAAVAVTAPSASAAPANCPGTFEVLHNDRIGGMQLPKGPYVVTVLDTATMGCTEASRLFSEFLEDWDGRLPRPWVPTNSTRTFQAGRGSGVGFRVTPDTNPNRRRRRTRRRGASAPATSRCSTTTGSAASRFRRGYRITLLSYRGLTCRGAVRRLQRFLQDWDGVPRGRGISTPARAPSSADTVTSASASSPTWRRRAPAG